MIMIVVTPVRKNFTAILRTGIVIRPWMKSKLLIKNRLVYPQSGPEVATGLLFLKSVESGLLPLQVPKEFLP